MEYLTDFQKAELNKASFFLDDRELFEHAKVTEGISNCFDVVKDLNVYAKVSVAQLFHHLVRNHPIMAIDEDDEWIAMESDREDCDCYYAERYPNLRKYVKKEGLGVRYYDKKYYHSQDHTFEEEREVKLPYLPPYERVVIEHGEYISDIPKTFDPAQRQVLNYLVGEAYAKGMNANNARN